MTPIIKQVESNPRVDCVSLRYISHKIKSLTKIYELGWMSYAGATYNSVYLDHLLKGDLTNLIQFTENKVDKK